MRKTTVAAGLVLFGQVCLVASFAMGIGAQASDSDADRNRQTAARIKSSINDLPFKLQLDGDKPIKITWKDGSRVAEYRAKTPNAKAELPIGILSSNCGRQRINPVCTLKIKVSESTERVMWTKHEDATKVGQAVADEYGQELNPSYLRYSTNLQLSDTSPERLLPMKCNSYDWLPGTKEYRWKIVSATTDSINRRVLKPNETISADTEVFDLDLILDKDGLFIKKPKFPADHLGVHAEIDDGEVSGELMALVGPTTWTIQSGNDICQVKLQGPSDLSELVAQSDKPNTPYLPVTYQQLMDKKRLVFPIGIGRANTVSMFERDFSREASSALTILDRATSENWFFLRRIGAVKNESYTRGEVDINNCVKEIPFDCKVLPRDLK